MNKAGIYIHIPFCRARCSYCDFATGAYDAALCERYVRAVEDEIASFKHDDNPVEVDTIYFGGGTPSLLAPAQVETILNSVHKRFRVASNIEVTMEMNPGTVTPETLRAYRRLGINRASFGAQTFDDRHLRRLGRTHSADDTRRTFDDLRANGYENISFDLIAALPGQTLQAWSSNLDEALRLRPEHLSLYLLEVHEGTPLAAQIRSGRAPQPDEDTAAEMYKIMLERTATEGYVHYEISNFCRSGYESRHNTKYWTGAPVFGFGCSAHSFDGRNTRWSNERDARRFVEALENGRETVVETIKLEAHEAAAENIFLGLRLMRGVDLGEHRKRFGADVCREHADDLARLTEAGLIELSGERLKLTSSGALLSNEVFAVFV
ncbi:MAG: radical SAM family heme chaperone HemW [Pyrinomonadaceae bacterium]|nr:radical SAM family heme chaperone HemW [Pyrinomonadaceae bacterium]